MSRGGAGVYGTDYMADTGVIQSLPSLNVTAVDELEAALSLERFGRYVKWASGDKNRALELYTLNSSLSESLYVPLQALELALRNRIHNVMKECYSERWFECQEFVMEERNRKQVEVAKSDLEREKPGSSGISSKVVAALTFSFWTSMVGAAYEELWRKTLFAIAKGSDGRPLPRKALSSPLTQIRLLRNRIAHHKPILYWRLPHYFDVAMDLTRYLSPPVATWCDSVQKFKGVYPAGGYVLNKPL